MATGSGAHVDGTVRLAARDDAALLAELGGRTFRDTFGADTRPEDLDVYVAASFGPDIQASELADPASRFLVFEVDGVPAGYARLRSGVAPACIDGVRPVEIVRFYVDAPWIGRGVAAKLMRACLEHARALGADVVWLDVWERNARAIAFYAKWDFVSVGVQDFVLGDDVQHDVLMSRPVGDDADPPGV